MNHKALQFSRLKEVFKKDFIEKLSRVVLLIGLLCKERKPWEDSSLKEYWILGSLNKKRGEKVVK